MVDRQVASVPDIDVSMQLGAGHPMGPLHLADYIGLELCLSILEGWCKEFPDEQVKSYICPVYVHTWTDIGLHVCVCVRTIHYRALIYRPLRSDTPSIPVLSPPFHDLQAFFVPEVLKQKVTAGHYGRKTGQGFYKWDGDKRLGPV